ncbi:MAG: hypothetical protein BWY70_01760 [Bacteroidetes bacterium ADurb.Bin408]|nr:MAG: hypothetical protein BWY70_01760 [Bacteroidetes bacterium ADurb.Bin408]
MTPPGLPIEAIITATFVPSVSHAPFTMSHAGSCCVFALLHWAPKSSGKSRGTRLCNPFRVGRRQGSPFFILYNIPFKLNTKACSTRSQSWYTSNPTLSCTVVLPVRGFPQQTIHIQLSSKIAFQTSRHNGIFSFISCCVGMRIFSLIRCRRLRILVLLLSLIPHSLLRGARSLLL